MKSIQQESLDYFTSTIKTIRVRYTTVENRKPNIKGVIVLTNLVLQLREDNKSSKLKQEFNWVNLNKINKSEAYFRFIFKQRKDLLENVNSCPTEQIIFKLQDESPEALSDFIESFSNFLPRVLRMSELQLTSFNLLKSRSCKPSTFSILSRLNMLRKLQFSSNCEMSFDQLKAIIVDHQNSINFAVFNDVDMFVQVLFQMLPLMDFIEIAKIPYLKKLNIYQCLASSLPELSSLKYLEITGPRDDGFDSFHHAIINSSLLGISYSESDLSKLDLNLIHESVLNADIHCIEFHNAVSKEVSVDFYTEFLNPEMRRHIWSLNLDRTINIDISQLTDNFDRLCSLSLANCGIDISLVLSFIHKNHLNYLTYLNLSGNMCNQHFDTDSIHLPSSLTHIMVNEVSWAEKSLIKFFTVVLRLNVNYTPLLLSLSIANAITLPNQWPLLFSFMKQQAKRPKPIGTTPSLEISEICERQKNLCIKKLIWDGNPVDKHFFDFLNENKNLETLSLNNCFNETLEDPITLLTKFIQSNDTITHLSVAGSKNAYIGHKISSVLQSCKGKHNLLVLDVSFSKCGSNYLQYFLPLFEEGNNSLQTVILDGIFPEDPISFLDFLRRIHEITKIRNVNYRPKLGFPQNDYELLINRNQLTPEDISEITDLYMKEDLSNVETPDPLYDQPMNVYKYFYEPFIPLYLTRNDVDLIYLHQPDEDEIPSKLIGFSNDSNDLLLNIQTLEKDSEGISTPKKGKKAKKTGKVKFNNLKKPVNDPNNAIQLSSDDGRPPMKKRQLKSLLQSSTFTSTLGGDESHISLILNQSSSSYSSEDESSNKEEKKPLKANPSESPKGKKKNQINKRKTNGKKKLTKKAKLPQNDSSSHDSDIGKVKPKPKTPKKKNPISPPIAKKLLYISTSSSDTSAGGDVIIPIYDAPQPYSAYSSTSDSENEVIEAKKDELYLSEYTSDENLNNSDNVSPKIDKKMQNNLTNESQKHSPSNKSSNASTKSSNASTKSSNASIKSSNASIKSNSPSIKSNSPSIKSNSPSIKSSGHSIKSSNASIKSSGASIKSSNNNKEQQLIDNNDNRIKPILIPRQIETAKEDKLFELNQNAKILIDNFIRQNQLNEEEIQSPQFTTPEVQTDIWSKINQELSIDILYQRIKNEKS